MEFVPHDYQRKAYKWIMDRPYCALFLDMGLGKTAVALSAVKALLQAGAAGPVLVIAPKTVAETTWTDEAAKWDHLSTLIVKPVLGSPAKREEALKQSAHVYVIGRDNTAWLVEKYGKRWPFKIVILDELSSFKNPQSKRFRALKKVRPYMDRVIGLTGTPAANGLEDLWAQIYLLDEGERLCRTITGFRCRWFRPGASNGHVVYNWIPLKGAREEIQSAISDICLSMSAEDYLTLPPLISREVKVKMTKAERKIYNEMKRNHIVELENDDITGANAAAVMNKLLQMANGRVYSDGGLVDIHRHKIAKLKEIVDTTAGAVLVFYNYQHDADAIMKEVAGVRKYGGPQDLKDWNAGKIKVLLAHPASCGYGLNMAAGGAVIVWYGLTWSLEQYSQANARLYRQGQTRPVIIHHIITEGTVDEQVMAALQNKNTTQTALLEALKAA